ncbi:hypothetical protein [Macrococcus equipercicus]|uniref:Uncharacterized protein n=1 Tax=Macrococcus equipercicus TaxID=69967 RepID=A0A9Q9BP98_9STAP|nr:hypothetical protein [Macrococcus equipercicus]UTH14175.1 hypothetical protein KFV11_02075 [Macrococcus equipercicus]
MMLKLPDITDTQIIEQMIEGTFNYNGIQYGSTYREVLEQLGRCPAKESSDYPTSFSYDYGDQDHSVTLSFSGKEQWKKKDFILLSFDYNHLDETMDVNTKAIRKLWGKPEKTWKDQTDWDDEGEFKTYRYRYGYTYMYFNKDKKLFAMSYYDKKLMKKWSEDW